MVKTDCCKRSYLELFALHSLGYQNQGWVSPKYCVRVHGHLNVTIKAAENLRSWLEEFIRKLAFLDSNSEWIFQHLERRADPLLQIMKKAG